MSICQANYVFLVGYLKADPEKHITQNGQSVLNLQIDVKRRYPSKKYDKISCVAWRREAEYISKYYEKGSAIAVSGILNTENWKDAQGIIHKKMFVNIKNVFALPKQKKITESEQDTEPETSIDYLLDEELEDIPEEELPY